MATDTSARILDAACDLIAEEGLDAVRIARVARRAGASTSLVHHYFSTREELLEQALIHSFERAGDDRFGTEGEVADAAPGASALAEAIRESLPAPEQEREWVLWVELWLRAIREPDLRPVANRLYSRYRAWLAAVVRAGIEAGDFDAAADPEEIADLAMAVLDGAGVRAMLADPGMDAERARGLVATAIAPRLGVEPGSLT
ncbi:MAG: TetR/AcrR family transcriptional regulator [Solirubrobacterales bacterium]